MNLATIIVTRSKSCHVKTLHGVLRLNIKCLQKGLNNQIVYVNDNPFEKADVIQKCMKTHDRIVFIDFGIGYGVFFKENNDLYCKLIEQKMLELNGLKFLYSKQQMTNDEFWSMYDKEYYDYIRSKYNIKLPDLYTKIKNN